MISDFKKNFEGAFNLPNFISFFRLLLAVPFYIILSLLHSLPYARYYVIGLICLAFLSDILDGFIARKKQLVTEFGKIIDPIADKTLVILIVFQLYLLDEIPGIYFWILILRDLSIFMGGIFLTRKIGKVLPSNLIGKITVLSIGFFFLSILFELDPTNFIYRFLFYISIILSFASVIAYALRGYEAIKWKNNESI
jgi:cardiolipin synthase (CMP-forming)